MDHAILIILGKLTITSTTVPITNEHLYAILNQGRSEATYIDFSMNCPHGGHLNNFRVEIHGLEYSKEKPHEWILTGDVAWAECMGAGQKVKIDFSTKTQTGTAEFMIGNFKNLL